MIPINFPSNEPTSALTNFPHGCGPSVKDLRNDVVVNGELRKNLIGPENNICVIVFDQMESLLMKKQRNSTEKEKEKEKFSNVDPLRNQSRLIPVKQKNMIIKVGSPREKVCKTLSLFKTVSEALDRENAVERGESKTTMRKIIYDTRKIILDVMRQVNTEKMIGAVPGIEVGDEFQYKAQLNLIGLHFSISGGIDYMGRGDNILATSIVVSEDSGYNDKFKLDEVIYCGQGGNVTNTNLRLIKHQKFATGNLALANSMKEKSVVRVICGKKILSEKRKHYIYCGLYLVQEYWQEIGFKGNVLFKFKLCRISGQPFVDLENI